MIDKLKALVARLRVRWHVLVLALAAASPEILNYLQIIDLRPILERFMEPSNAAFVVGIMPFLLVFLKSAFRVEPEEDK